MDEIVVEERYSGIPGTALGGYVAGLLGRDAEDALEVALHQPVKIGDVLSVTGSDESPQLCRGEQVVASASPVTLDMELPPLVSPDEAEEASEHYIGRHHHFFPRCFCCGPERPVGDGLRIFPGLTPSGTAVAAPWRTAGPWAEGRETVPLPVVWGALDCPAIWAHIVATARSGDKAVTGRMAVRILRPVPVGSSCVAVGWPISKAGRLILAGSALLSNEGETLAVSRQTMVVTSAGVPVDKDSWLDAPPPSNGDAGRD
jgi:hypothetical protein